MSLYVYTRKYPLRGYILGSGAPGNPGVTLKQLLVTSCDSTTGIGASLRTDAQRTTHNTGTEGQTDLTLEIVF